MVLMIQTPFYVGGIHFNSGFLCVIGEQSSSLRDTDLYTHECYKISIFGVMVPGVTKQITQHNNMPLKTS